MAKVRAASSLEVKGALDKLVDAGVIAMSQGGHYVAAFPDVSGPNILPALKNLTRKYGELKGMEAATLAIIPFALQYMTLTLDQATQIVNAGLASVEPKNEADLHRILGV